MAYKKLSQKFEEYKAFKGIDAMSKEALDWFYANARKLAGVATYSKSKDLGKQTTHIVPGRFYLYNYDPKLKETLPFYDTCPYILVTKVMSDGWYGINFHYMPPWIRLKIMDGLYDTINSETTDIRKLKINWKRAEAIAKEVGSHSYLKHSIKRYLRSHVMSNVLEIEPDNWALTVFLPLSRFKKTNSTNAQKLR
jgi:hypothetical protein